MKTQLSDQEVEALQEKIVLDGYTETTWLYNLEKIIQIYEKHGGVRLE